MNDHARRIALNRARKKLHRTVALGLIGAVAAPYILYLIITAPWSPL